MASSSCPTLLRNKGEGSTDIGSTGNRRVSRNKIKDGRVWGGDAERANVFCLRNLEVL
jgi:hypothetical protein